MSFYFWFLLIGLVFGALIWFSNPKLSPIPYYPTLEKDIQRIKQALNLQPKDVLYDLGAGDGKIVFRLAAAKIKVVAVESNPYLVALMHLKRLFSPYKKQIVILWQDLFKTDLSEATHIYLFVGPSAIKQIFTYINSQPRPKLKRIVSYRYHHPGGDMELFDNLKYPIYLWIAKKGSGGH